MKLKTYLDKRGLTQGEFAKRIGVKQPVVSRWVNGRVPRAEFVRLIVRATKGSVELTDWPTPRPKRRRRK